MTPSNCSARLESMRLMRACGCGECRIFPMSIPGSVRSSVYLPAPVVLPAASTMAIALPMMEKSGIGLLPRLVPRDGQLSQIRHHNNICVDPALSQRNDLAIFRRIVPPSSHFSGGKADNDRAHKRPLTVTYFRITHDRQVSAAVTFD